MKQFTRDVVSAVGTLAPLFFFLVILTVEIPLNGGR
jgi:hypothetical protein